MSELNTKIVTRKPCKWSFVHLMEPYAFDAADTPKYSVRLLIPKDDKETLGMITSTVKNMLTDPKVTAKLGNMNLKMALGFLHDGDETDLDKYPEQEGCFIINVSNTRPVDVRQVIAGKMVPVTDPTEIYSGCEGLVSFNLFAYNNKKKGISCSLNNCVKTADGESLGGTSSKASDDFADVFPEGGGADEDMSALLNI